MYSGDSTTPIESHLVTGLNTGTGFQAEQIGAVLAQTVPLGATIYLDDLAYGTAGWLGPSS
jgi:hypothetical protein